MEPDSQWFVAREGHAVGPLKMEEILAMYSDRSVTDETYVLKGGEEEWIPLGKTAIGALRASTNSTRLAEEVIDLPAISAAARENGHQDHPKADAAKEPPALDLPTATAEGVWSKLAGKVGDAAGLERLEGFSLGHMFSEAFRKHSAEEIEEHFIVGTRGTTPPLGEVATSWPTP